MRQARRIFYWGIAGLLLISGLWIIYPYFTAGNRVEQGPLESGVSEHGASLEKAASGVSTIQLPFLGSLKVRNGSRSVQIQRRDGSTVDMLFTISTLEDGRFLTAEYTRGEVPSYYRLPMDYLETDYRGLGEEITGIPNEDGSKAFDVVLKRLPQQITLEQATRVQINYVMLRNADNQNDKPVFIANVFGVETISRHVGTNAGKRIRFVFSKDGELLYMDNLL